jgi:hypothetical protein
MDAMPAPGRASEREVYAVTGVTPSVTIKEQNRYSRKRLIMKPLAW